MIAVKVTIVLLLARCTEFDWLLPKGDFFSNQLKYLFLAFLVLNFMVDETTEILLLHFI